MCQVSDYKGLWQAVFAQGDTLTLVAVASQFSLPMIVHDTDNIRIVVEAPGYMTYEKKLDLFGDRSLDIGLTP